MEAGTRKSDFGFGLLGIDNPQQTFFRRSKRQKTEKLVSDWSSF
jgi:hypothetical protein